MTTFLAVVLVALLAAPAAASAAPTLNLTKLPPQEESGGYLDPVPLSGVSCPTGSLCVAVGALDTVAVSAAPAPGR